MVQAKRILTQGWDLLIRRQSGILSAAFVIAFTYGLSMILGIFRERLLVSRFFSCCPGQLDAYYAAFRLPDMIFQMVVIGALSAAFIPVFSEHLEKDEQEANYLASSLINLFLGLFLILAVFIFIFARPFSALITGNFSPDQIDLMAQMTRVMLLAQVFFLVSNFFSAMVQSHQRFLLPSLSPLVYNLGIMAMVFFFSRTLGIWSACLGVLVGALCHLLIQIPLVFRLGFRYSFSFDYHRPGVRKVIKLMLPRTLALAASQVEATVSLFLATSLSAGSLTLYYLAQKLVDLPVRLLGTSIGQAALPILSLQLARKEIADFKRTLSQSLGQIIYLALPATAIFLVLRVQFVRFAYGARTFPWEATIATGRTLAAVAFSIFSQSALQLIVRGFYALGDTITPFAVSVLAVVVNIILSFLFIFVLNLGIFGLALAFSLANFLSLALLLVLFNWKKEKFLSREDFWNWGKMSLASVVAAFATWGSMKLLDKFVFETSRSLPLLLLTVISGSIGLLFYLLLSFIFRFKELQVVLRLGKKISQWRKSLFAVQEIIEPYAGAGGTSAGSV